MAQYGLYVLGKRKAISIEAKNLKQATSKALRMYPRSKLNFIYRKSSAKGREYERYYF